MKSLLDRVQFRGTLRHQVRVAARQVAERRQAVKLRRAQLGDHLHESLASPDMLLFAAGTGFVIGEFAGRAGRGRDSEQAPKPRQRPMARAEAALRFAFKTFTLAHAAITAMSGPPEIQDR